jgi:hypothetical protein
MEQDKRALSEVLLSLSAEQLLLLRILVEKYGVKLFDRENLEKLQNGIYLHSSS